MKSTISSIRSPRGALKGDIGGILLFIGSSSHFVDAFLSSGKRSAISRVTRSVMKRSLYSLPGITLLTLWIAPYEARAQVSIRGTVYDRSMTNGLPAVTISNGHGAIAISDTSGHYTIKVLREDTIYFSYLQKRTVAFPIKDIWDTTSFNVSIDAAGPALMPVYVSHNSYYMDSILNRRENREGFDYQKGIGLRNIRMMPGGKGIMAGVSLDLDMFFNRDVRRSKELMQRWLIEEEQDKYIDHRFNRVLVRKITGLDSADLRLFMKTYRPSYSFLKSMATDWEFYKYIKDCGNAFLAEAKDSIHVP
jgi:hypothetical protein